VVAGARPNFMKVAPVLRALRRSEARLSAELVHTGQHYDEGMSSVFIAQLGLPSPAACLDVGSGPHGLQTGRVMAELERYLLDSGPPPAGVVVVGDVNSTMAAALVAVKLGVPVAHVEAGLRSFDRSMPEEINRIVTDAVSDLLFVTEPSGEENLRLEGIPAARVRAVGNVMIDTLIHELAAARALDVRAQLGLESRPCAVVTLHRPANVDDPEALSQIVDFIVDRSRDIDVAFPVHPRTRARLTEFGLLERFDGRRVRVLEPLAYREMLALMDGAVFVLTDSGGVQEETTFLGVPCLTLRERTERPITVTHGTNTLVGRDLVRAGAIVDEIGTGSYKRGRPIPGWDGCAATRVADALVDAWA
jgi:UDP-N-acetylglucosamine 2-epimerase (non-hydrolysing)